VRRHDPQHSIEGGGARPCCRLGNRPRQALVEQPRQVIRRRCRRRIEARPQRLEQRVVARQRALQFGQFLALGEQALGQRLLRGQHAFAQAAGEGILADGAGLFETAGILEVELRPGAQQVGRIHHAVEGRQFAVADALLQRDAGNAEQVGGTGKGQPLRHGTKHSEDGPPRDFYFL
jgi:hypothetical protein